MDTSKKYINMCEKAVEIQEDWLPKCLDICLVGKAPEKYYVKSRDMKSVVSGSSHIELGYFTSTYLETTRHFREYIWLPRQDQLQDMVLDKFDCPSHSACANIINLGSKFRIRINNHHKGGFDYWIQFTSMEQLWLAFVMKEKYNKTWNGTEWIKD